MKKRFGKTDILVLAIVFAVLSGIWIFTSFIIKEEGADVVITIDGEFYKQVSLREDQEIKISGDETAANILKIQDGKADMVEADCPDKLCVHQKSISKNGETIVCLPNKVVVEVKSGEDAEYDSVAR